MMNTKGCVLFFIGISALLSPAYAGYYFVSSGVNPDAPCCEYAPPPSHYSSSSKHHKKRSSYKIDVYYVWYTYSGSQWIPSNCGTCGAPRYAIWRHDCQFVYTPANVPRAFYKTEAEENNDNLDTRTQDDVDDRY